MSEHLDFNTDFLNQTESSKKGGNAKLSGNIPSEPYNWKKLLVIIAVIVFVIWIVAANSDSSSTSSNSYTPPPSTSTYTSSVTSDSSVVTGTYRCSQYNHDRAGQLEPSDSELASLKSTESFLSTRSDSLDREKIQIENEYVDAYDQDSIDNHNAAVDAFNVKLQNWKNQVAANSDAIDSYNSRIRTYNNFLIANCTHI